MLALVPIIRHEGETPNGGAYADLITDEDGSPLEVIEYAKDGSALMRTYTDHAARLHDTTPAPGE